MASCLRNVCVGLLVVLLPYCVSAGRDNRGTEFILGFMQNKGSSIKDIELFVTTAADDPVAVKVTLPLFDRNFKKEATVVKGVATMIAVPHTIRGYGDEESNKGVLIQASDEVTVYAVNKAHTSTDAYLALPVDVLDREYYAMSYSGNPQLLVVATENDTTVNISCPVSNPYCVINFNNAQYRAGDIFTINLDKFKTFHAIGSETGDFTGIHVTSDKPISFVSGNIRIGIHEPWDSHTSSDHLTEQMMPVTTWGNYFITPSTPYRTIGDLFRIVASEDSTSVTFYNGAFFNLNKAGDFAQFNIPSGHYQTINASKPIMLAMFSKTWQGFAKDGPYYGDPAMSIIIPELQYASDYTWSTVKEAEGNDFNSSVLVIVDKSKKLGLRLDGEMVDWTEEKEILGNSDKLLMWVNTTAGSHTLYHVNPTDTFMALVSGVFKHNSYAYLAGLRLAQINAVCHPTFSTTMKIGDIIDNDCDRKIDEELLDGIDNDGDGRIDEDLSAYPPELYWCEVTGDPHTRMLGGQMASIPYPCQYKVADLRFNDYNESGIPTFNESVVEVTIMGSNRLQSINGQYYVDAISVIVVLIAAGGVQTPVGTFTTSAERMHSDSMSAWEVDWDTTNVQHRSRIQLDDVPAIELAELTIAGISLIVEFYPFNDKDIQPGVFIEVGSDVIPDDRALFPATMCSTIDDVKSPLLRAWGVPVSIKDVGLFAAVKQALAQTIGGGLQQDMCSSVIDVYENCETNQSLALASCSKALADPAVLSCATSELGDNTQLGDDAAFGIFVACLDAFCVAEAWSTACAFLNVYDSACPGKWPEIKQFICQK